jgi:hypothetical protein
VKVVRQPLFIVTLFSSLSAFSAVAPPKVPQAKLIELDPQTEIRRYPVAKVERRRVDEHSLSELISAQRDLEPKQAGAYPAIADDVEELELPSDRGE